LLFFPEQLYRSVSRKIPAVFSHDGHQSALRQLPAKEILRQDLDDLGRIAEEMEDKTFPARIFTYS